MTISRDVVTDETLALIFGNARKTMGLSESLRFVVEEVERIRSQQVPAPFLAVVDEVARRFETTRRMLLGRDQMKFYKPARMLAFYVLHEKFDFSYPVIGRFFDGRDHSTIQKMLDADGYAERVRRNDILRATVASVYAAASARLERKVA